MWNVKLCKLSPIRIIADSFPSGNTFSIILYRSSDRKRFIKNLTPITQEKYIRHFFSRIIWFFRVFFFLVATQDRKSVIADTDRQKISERRHEVGIFVQSKDEKCLVWLKLIAVILQFTMAARSHPFKR